MELHHHNAHAATTDRTAVLAPLTAGLVAEAEGHGYSFRVVASSPALGADLWISLDGEWCLSCWDWEERPWRLRRARRRARPPLPGFVTAGSYATLAEVWNRIAKGQP